MSTKRSYLVRSTFPAVYLRPPLATIRRISLRSSSCILASLFQIAVLSPNHGSARAVRPKAAREGLLLRVGSLFGGPQFLGKATPKITLRCFHQPGHQIFRHSVDRSILIDFGVD